MTVLAAVAQFERDLLIEQEHAGLARAKAEGKKLGRKGALTVKKSSDPAEAGRGGYGTWTGEGVRRFTPDHIESSAARLTRMVCQRMSDASLQAHAASRKSLLDP